jgi:hypothetical protein
MNAGAMAAADGFTISWDMVNGLPQKYRYCQMVYGVYDRGEVKQSPKLVSGVYCEAENEYSNRATFGTNYPVNGVPSLSTTILLLEIHMAHEKPASQDRDALVNVGWTALDLFSSRRELQAGYWRLPVYKPPTDTRISIYDIRSKQALSGTFVYIRLSPGGVMPQ